MMARITSDVCIAQEFGQICKKIKPRDSFECGLRLFSAMSYIMVNMHAFMLWHASAEEEAAKWDEESAASAAAADTSPAENARKTERPNPFSSTGQGIDAARGFIYQRIQEVVGKTRPLSCASTAFVAKAVPFLADFQASSFTTLGWQRSLPTSSWSAMRNHTANLLHPPLTLAACQSEFREVVSRLACLDDFDRVRRCCSRRSIGSSRSALCSVGCRRRRTLDCGR